jgi:hypothetical protein
MKDRIDALYPAGHRFLEYDDLSGRDIMPGETAFAFIEKLAREAKALREHPLEPSSGGEDQPSEDT